MIAYLYYGKERDAIEKQSETLRGNIEEIETWIEKKKKEMESLDVSSAEYEEVSGDLASLQDAHQQYTLA